jgi:hypothetical protein
MKVCGLRHQVRFVMRSAALATSRIRGLVAQRDLLARRVKKAYAQRRRLRESVDLRKGQLRQELATLRQAAGRWPPGHYHSPIPNLDEVTERQDTIWSSPRSLPGIDVKVDGQLKLLEAFATYYAEQPFKDEPVNGLRYGFSNPYFSYGDGLALYCMLRHVRPTRLVEVGSGWSSALALDVVDRFLGDDVSCIFIEPYPKRLRELIHPADADRVEIFTKPLHDVDAALFTNLQSGDILLIDSTHVSRVGSDVNQLVHDVLPILPRGIHVHFHDIFWPFEYPREWIFSGRAWNEAYLLRAYLTHNPRANISWFNNYLATFHADQVAAVMPMWSLNPGGSLWFVTR